jgi:hypothetical protein
MPHDFPYGVVVILGSGLIFTIYVIYYILRMAFLEMQDEEPSNHSVSDKSGD